MTNDIAIFVATRREDVPAECRTYASVDGSVPGARATWDHHVTGEPINLDAMPRTLDPRRFDGVGTTHPDTDALTSVVAFLIGGEDALPAPVSRAFRAASHWCDHLRPDPAQPPEANRLGAGLHQWVSQSLSHAGHRERGETFARLCRHVVDVVRRGAPLPSADERPVAHLRDRGRILEIGPIALFDVRGIASADPAAAYSETDRPLAVFLADHPAGGVRYTVGVNPHVDGSPTDLRPALARIARAEHAVGHPTLAPTPTPGAENWGGRQTVFGSPWNHGSRLHPHEVLSMLIDKATPTHRDLRPTEVLRAIRAANPQWVEGDLLSDMVIEEHEVRLRACLVAGLDAPPLHDAERAAFGALFLIHAAHVFSDAGVHWDHVFAPLTRRHDASWLTNPRRDWLAAGARKLGVELIRVASGRRMFRATAFFHSRGRWPFVEALAPLLSNRDAWARLDSASRQDRIAIWTNDVLPTITDPTRREMGNRDQVSAAMAAEIARLAGLFRDLDRLGHLTNDADTTIETLKTAGFAPRTLFRAPSTEHARRFIANVLGDADPGARQAASWQWRWALRRDRQSARLTLAVPPVLRVPGVGAPRIHLEVLGARQKRYPTFRETHDDRFEHVPDDGPSVLIVPPRLEGPLTVIAVETRAGVRNESHVADLDLDLDPAMCFDLDTGHPVRGMPQAGQAVAVVFGPGHAPDTPPGFRRLDTCGLVTLVGDVPERPIVFDTADGDWVLGPGQRRFDLRMRAREVHGLRLGGARVFSSWPTFITDRHIHRGTWRIDGPAGTQEGAFVGRSHRIPVPEPGEAVGRYTVTVTEHDGASIRRHFAYWKDLQPSVRRHDKGTSVALGGASLRHAGAPVIGDLPKTVVGPVDLDVHIDAHTHGRWRVVAAPQMARLEDDDGRELDPTSPMKALYDGSYLHLFGDPGATVTLELRAVDPGLDPSAPARGRVRSAWSIRIPPGGERLFDASLLLGATGKTNDGRMHLVVEWPHGPRQQILLYRLLEVWPDVTEQHGWVLLDPHVPVPDHEDMHVVCIPAWAPWEPGFQARATPAHTTAWRFSPPPTPGPWMVALFRRGRRVTGVRALAHGEHPGGLTDPLSTLLLQAPTAQDATLRTRLLAQRCDADPEFLPRVLRNVVRFGPSAFALSTSLAEVALPHWLRTLARDTDDDADTDLGRFFREYAWPVAMIPYRALADELERRWNGSGANPPFHRFLDWCRTADAGLGPAARRIIQGDSGHPERIETPSDWTEPSGARDPAVERRCEALRRLNRRVTRHLDDDRPMHLEYLDGLPAPPADHPIWRAYRSRPRIGTRLEALDAKIGAITWRIHRWRAGDRQEDVPTLVADLRAAQADAPELVSTWLDHWAATADLGLDTPGA